MRYQIKAGKQNHTQGKVQRVIYRQGLAKLVVTLKKFYGHATLSFHWVTHYTQTMNIKQTHIHTYKNKVYKYADNYLWKNKENKEWIIKYQ